MVNGGRLISAVTLTGGTSRYGRPQSSSASAAAAAAERFCRRSRYAYGAPPAVTVISGLAALGVIVQSLTPTVIWSTAAVWWSNVLACCWSTLPGCARPPVVCCGTGRAIIVPSAAAAVGRAAVVAPVAGRPVSAAAGCSRLAAPNSRLTVSKTRATRSGRSYGSRTTGNTGLGINRRRQTNGDGRDGGGGCS